MKILIVDDTPDNLLTLQCTLEELSVELIQASSGYEALKLLLDAQELPALAILDIQMPNMNGYELAETMQKHERIRHVPIIFLSAIYFGEQYTFQCYQSGCVDFLTKPFNPDVLRAKARVFLNFALHQQELKKSYIEQDKLREQLYRTQKLANLGQLTGGLAHDFNNLLMAISGYNDLAKMYVDDIQNNIDPNLDDCFVQITNASVRAKELTKQLLNYSQQNPDFDGIEELSCALLLSDEAIKMLKHTLPSNIIIMIEVEGNLPKIYINPSKFNQIIVNLIINARDAFNHGHGKITVGLSSVEIQHVMCSACGGLIQGQYLQLSVTDTGSGIDPDKIAKIFDPFFTTKELGKGTGLGLASVTGIVHKSGGHIILTSVISEGTTFNILFPIPKLI